MYVLTIIPCDDSTETILKCSAFESTTGPKHSVVEFILTCVSMTSITPPGPIGSSPWLNHIIPHSDAIPFFRHQPSSCSLYASPRSHSSLSLTGSLISRPPKCPSTSTAETPTATAVTSSSSQLSPVPLPATDT
jgi:hypothetical protein